MFVFLVEVFDCLCNLVVIKDVVVCLIRMIDEVFIGKLLIMILVGMVVDVEVVFVEVCVV